jgi:hypothetical protein
MELNVTVRVVSSHAATRSARRERGRIPPSPPFQGIHSQELNLLSLSECT